MKKLLEISTWYSFPEIPDIFTPSRQFMLGKGRTSSKKKNNDVDCYLKNCSNIKKPFRTLEATRSVKAQPRD